MTDSTVLIATEVFLTPQCKELSEAFRKKMSVNAHEPDKSAKISHVTMRPQVLDIKALPIYPQVDAAHLADHLG